MLNGGSLQRSVPVDKPIAVVIAQSTDDVIVLKAVLSLVGLEHFGQFWIA